MFDALRKCYELVGEGRRGKWAALVVLALVVTAAEAIGAALVFVLIALVTDPQAAPSLPVVGDLGRFVDQPNNDMVLLAVAVSIAVFFALRSALVFVQTYAQQRVAHNAGAQLATRLIRGYLKLPYAFHLTRNSAESIRNALQSVQSVINNFVVHAVRLSAEGLMVIGLLLVLVVASPMATLMAVGLLGPLVVFMLRVLHPRIKRLGQQAQDAMRDSIQTAQQSLEGVRDVKLLGREGYFAADFARSRRAFAHSYYMRGALAELPSVLIETGLVIFIVAFFAVALVAEDSAGNALSVLGLFAYVGLRLQPSLRKIAASLNNMKFGLAAVDDVHADVRVIEDADAVQPAVDTPLPFDERLELDNVTFVYEGTSTPALQDANLVIHAGEAVGICGPTGGGKSTLVDLIVGLLEPTHGAVRVDELDIREHVTAWQRQLGVVSQSVFLVDDTLRRNIAFGLDEDAIDEELVDAAVRMAQLEPFVDALPHGLETQVGERGTRLSGGQRQRVAIARALYRDPSVVVFDEGTSALDNDTEAEVIHALEGLRGERTVIMVAHRLSTVRHCDRILVVEGGRIADIGTFSELSARNRLFADFSAP